MSINLICAVILANSSTELIEQGIEAFNQGSNYVECRLDGLEEINFEKLEEFINNNKQLPIIFTIRSEWNNKEIKPPLIGRSQTIRKIIEMRPRYVDLEYPIDMNLLKYIKSPTIPILSMLDFEGMAKIAFDSVIQVARKLEGEVIVKISAKPNSVEDLKQLWRWSKKLKKEDIKYVVLGMGQLGQITRIKSKELGNQWMYGRMGNINGEPYLPGMLSIQDLREAFSDNSWHLASFGQQGENDALRTIYKELLKAAGLNGTFLNIPIQTSPELDQMLLWMEDGLLDGGNISSPWQVDVLNKLDLKDPSVLRMGACNSVVITKNGLKGFNTQIQGLKRTLEPYSLKRINSVYIEGTERIARAIILALENHVDTIVVRDKLFSEKNDLFYDFPNIIPGSESFSETFDLVVNCNKPDQGFENVVMLPKKIVENSKIVFDPMSKLTEPTALLKLAQKLDKKLIDGFQFFFNTALSSFEKWTKRSIPTSSIDKKLFESYVEKIDFGFMLNY